MRNGPVLKHVVLCLSVFCCCVESVPADEKPVAKSNAISLLKKNLDGWEKTNFGSEADVSIKDGVLIIEMGSPLTGVNIKPEAFEKLPKINYEITLEAKRALGGDFFVGLTFPVKTDSCSLIMGGWGGGVIGISSLDTFDASENETTTYHTFKNNQWYKIHLRVLENRLQVWLDGEKTIDVDTTDKKISTRIEVSLSEPLGLCTFETTAHIRNFQIRPLNEEEIKQAQPE